jgi:hypothetical protein
MPSSGSSNGERQGELFIFLTHANFMQISRIVGMCSVRQIIQGYGKAQNTSNHFVEHQQHANQEHGSLKWKVAQLSSGSRILLSASCLSAKWHYLIFVCFKPR